MHFILEDIKTCLGRLPHNRANTIGAVKKIKHLMISSEKNEAPHYFFRKKTKLIIISSEKNEVPHYFFRQK